jgi:hypothetical protein
MLDLALLLRLCYCTPSAPSAVLHIRVFAWICTRRTHSQLYFTVSAGLFANLLLLVMSKCFFFLWLYSPIQALDASMKLSVSLQLLDLGQSVGLLRRVISSSQGLSTCTQTLNIHARSRIRTHGPGVRASGDSSCLRPLGYRDRPMSKYYL